MHHGPYSEEGPTVRLMHDFIEHFGGGAYGLGQKHHEI